MEGSIADVESGSHEQTARLAPTRPKERIIILDVLRGFALIGVLLVNSPDIAWESGPSASRVGFLHDAIGGVISFLFGGRFIGLFSILFGVGFALQIQRAQAKGGRFFSIYVRRLSILFVFGVIHSLFYPGDILIRYALLGLLLPLAFRIPTRSLLVMTIILVILTGVGPSLGRMTGRVASQPVVSVLEDLINSGFCTNTRDGLINLGFEGRRYVYERGTLPDVMAINLCRLPSEARWWIRSWRLARVLAFFLIGLLLMKIDFFNEFVQRRHLLKRIMLFGGVIGFALLALGTRIPEEVSELFESLRGVARMGGGYLTTVAYGCGIILAFQTSRGRKILLPLASVGRMALTAYLAQSLIVTTLFYGYGLGWGKSIGSLSIVGLSLGIYLVLIPACVWWMKHFRFGPLEWVWRSITYGSFQPMLAQGNGETNPART